MGGTVVKRIECLTGDQEALLASWREQWLAHGLSTERSDRPRAEAGVRLAYQIAGLKPPKVVIWLESPLAGCIGAMMFAELKGSRAQVRNQVWARIVAQALGRIWGQLQAQVVDQVWGQLQAQVVDQVQVQVVDQVVNQVVNQVWDQVWGQVVDQVRGQVWDEIRGQVQARVVDQVRDQVQAQVVDHVRTQVVDRVHISIYGQHDAYLSFYDYMHKVVAVPGAQQIAGLVEVAQSAGWWWAFADAVIITERPTELHRDQQFRLHCETGLALAYSDGWGIYAWHGTRVPGDLIAGKWSIDDILREPNVEIRRCAIERMGWPQFITQAGLRRVGAVEPDPANPGCTIALYDLPKAIYEEPVRILLCTNGTVERDGTRRSFGLTVPASIPSALAAAAWGYGLDCDQYAQLARRT